MVKMVLMEKREILVPVVTQGLMVHPVNLDKLVRPVYREHQVTKGNQDSEDLQGKRALKAREDPRAHLENKGHGEPSETEAHKEVRVMLAHLELVSLGPKGTLVQVAIQVLVEMMESRGRVERMEYKDLQGLLAPREIKVMQGLKATKEIQEKRQSFRAPKGREVKLAEMVWMALMEPTVNPDPLDSLETLDRQGT